MKKFSIYDKIQNLEYIENLSESTKNKLNLCLEMLTENEIKSHSSIQVAYGIAKDRFIDEYLMKINPEFAKRAKEGDIPIFNKEEILKSFKNNL